MNPFLVENAKKIEIPDYGYIELFIENRDANCSAFFEMAVRKNNTKRKFLFVSKLLGKHIPIEPAILFNSCRQLVDNYAQTNKLLKNNSHKIVCTSKTLIIGFAETATAMGHSVFNCFAGDCFFVHTTRHKVNHYQFAFEFKEEHCHATEQLFFLQNENWIRDAKEIIIVDDEITTGKTIRNIIDQIDRYYPQKKYSIITFLDWRNKEDRQAFNLFSAKKNSTISFFSFMQGHIKNVKITNNTIDETKLKQPRYYNPVKENWQFHYCNSLHPQFLTAGAGINICQQKEIIQLSKNIAQRLLPHMRGNKRAVVGTGEFMYIPMLIASYLNGHNYCNATTRSPIIANNKNSYGIKKAIRFICPYDTDRVEYLYNSNILECDEIVIFFENRQPIENLHSMLSQLDNAGYLHKHVVFIK